MCIRDRLCFAGGDLLLAHADVAARLLHGGTGSLPRGFAGFFLSLIHICARNHAEVHNLYRKSLRLIAVVAVTLTLASMFIIPCVARIFVGYDAESVSYTHLDVYKRQGPHNAPCMAPKMGPRPAMFSS